MGKPTPRQQLGRWGEDLAARYLCSQGYQILACNARTPFGELDLVARPPGEAVTVFVEVKTRRSTSLGLPEISVTARKQAHLLAAAQAFLLSHPELDGPCRVDVIAIQCLPDQTEPQIAHFENAVIGA